MANQRFSKVEGEALEAVAGGIIERAIASLQGIGLSREGALSMLVLQAAIQMDKAEVERLLKYVEGGLVPP
jgi:hypothetical protein